MRGRSLMVQGTASYAGKTVLVAALCRTLARSGVRVAPFKAQNMSLNSYVTPDGREIARAQAFQAFAAGVEPRVEMNPVLLKPMGGMVSQVVLMGRPFRDISALEFYSKFAMRQGLDAVKRSLRALLSEYEVVVIEGAGSPAEINLYDREIANMKVAALARAPVFLVADIERGGVFASVVGTLSLLKRADLSRVKGIIINKFRGDLSLLEPGLKRLEKVTGRRVLGVVPFVEGLEVPWEDSVSLDELKGTRGGERAIDVAVIRLPFISNFTDFHPLARAGMKVRFVKSSEELGNPDLVILPGTKNTVGDLRWLRTHGIDAGILRLRRGGAAIIGICGGYQMLGRRLSDPLGIEGGEGGGEYPGLGLLDVETRFARYAKKTRRVTAEVAGEGPLLGPALGGKLRAYEIHMGDTALGSDASPFLIVGDGRTAGSPRPEGAMSADGLVFGSYLHGLFDDGTITTAIRAYMATRGKGEDVPGGPGAAVEAAWRKSLDLFCGVLRSHVDVDWMLETSGIKVREESESWKPSKRAF